MADDSRIYVRNRDKGTTFYDSEQDATVVANRIERVSPTARVMQAIQNSQLVQLDADEAKPIYVKQRKQMIADGLIEAPKKKETSEDEDAEEETESEPVKTAAKAPVKTTANK